MSGLTVKSALRAYPFGLVAREAVPLPVGDVYSRQSENEKERNRMLSALADTWSMSLSGAADRVARISAKSGTNLATIYRMTLNGHKFQI